MKVEKIAPEFTPTTITLESQGEVDLMVALLSTFNGNHENDMIHKMYMKLGGNEALADSRYTSLDPSRVTKKEGI